MNLNKNNKSFKIKDACKSLKKCLDSKKEYLAIEQADDLKVYTAKTLSNTYNISERTARDIIVKYGSIGNKANAGTITQAEYDNYIDGKHRQQLANIQKKSSKILKSGELVIANSFKKIVEDKKADEILQIGAVFFQTAIEKLNNENGELKAENDTLKIKVGLSQKYYSVKKVAILNNKKQIDYNWRILKIESVRQGKEIKSEIDNNYGNVNSYHIDVWKNVYPEEKY